MTSLIIAMLLFGQVEQSSTVFDTAEAVEVAERITNEARATDQANGEYPFEYALELLQFYHYGAGTKETPSHPRVIKEFCREFVISLLWDLFNVGKTVTEDQEEFKNVLKPKSKELFRAVLTVILVTARDDLEARQEASLYHLSAMAFTRDDTVALLALDTLAKKTDKRSPRYSFIMRIIEKIKEKKGEG